MTSVYKRKESLPIKRVIEQYLEDFPPSGRTKLSDLKKLLNMDICKLNVPTLTAKDLIKRRNFKHIDY